MLCCSCGQPVYEGFQVAPNQVKCRDCIERDNGMTFEEFMDAPEEVKQ
jgi:hypothetical protein